jgi:hypothetical protein
VRNSLQLDCPAVHSSHESQTSSASGSSPFTFSAPHQRSSWKDLPHFSDSRDNPTDGSILLKSPQEEFQDGTQKSSDSSSFLDTPSRPPIPPDLPKPDRYLRRPSDPPAPTTETPQGTPQAKLFQFTYDTFTRNRLEALVEEIEELGTPERDPAALEPPEIDDEGDENLWEESFCELPDQAEEDDENRPILRSSKRIRLSPGEGQEAQSNNTGPKRNPLGERRTPSRGSFSPRRRVSTIRTTEQPRNLPPVRDRLGEAKALMERIKARAAERSSAGWTSTEMEEIEDGLEAIPEEQTAELLEEAWAQAQATASPENTLDERMPAALRSSKGPASTRLASSANNTASDESARKRQDPLTDPPFSSSTTSATKGHGLLSPAEERRQPHSDVTRLASSLGKSSLGTTSNQVDETGKAIAAAEVDRNVAPLPSRFAAAASASLRNVLAGQRNASTTAPSPHLGGRRFSTAPADSVHRRQPIHPETFSSSQAPSSSKMTTIAPSDFDAEILVAGSTGQMKFDPVMKKWVRVAPDGMNQKSGANEDDVFDEFESFGPGNEDKDKSASVVRPLSPEDESEGDEEVGMEVEVDLEDGSDSDIDDRAWGGRDWATKESVGGDDEAEEPRENGGEAEEKAEDDEEEEIDIRDPVVEDPHDIASATPSPTTPVPPHRAAIQPRSALKSKTDSAVVTSTPERSVSSSPKLPRSVSFSDGRTTGKILGLHDDDELVATTKETPVFKSSSLKYEVAVVEGESSYQTKSEASADGVLDDSKGSMVASARTKRIENALNELEGLGAPPLTPPAIIRPHLN